MINVTDKWIRQRGMNIGIWMLAMQLIIGTPTVKLSAETVGLDT
ncbi:hypothetical protein [Paenibacillus periandrae]|nr:hypothetical protein [Paenibacillus periandrae]